jgi:hypothetical protein
MYGQSLDAKPGVFGCTDRTLLTWSVQPGSLDSTNINPPVGDV